MRVNLSFILERVENFPEKIGNENWLENESAVFRR